MAAKSPLSELREMNVRRQRETQNPAEEDTDKYATGSTVAQKQSSAVGSAHSNANSSAGTQAVLLPTILPTHADPIKAALLAALNQPFPDPLPRGQATVTSIKLHNEIWQRLGYAQQITGKNKQDLIAEALTDLFAKIVRREGPSNPLGEEV